MDKIDQVIAEKIRPILQAHQGDMEVVEITADGIVKVRLTGACANCPGAQQTLSDVVEEELRATCPAVKKVEAVCQVSDDLIQEALKILRKEKRSHE